MKEIIIKLIILIGLTTTIEAGAFEANDELVKAPIVDVEVSPDQNELNFTAVYHNTCFEPWLNAGEVDEDKLVVLHVSQYETDEVCSRVFNYVEFQVSTAEINTGDYKVVDGFDGEVLGTLKVEDDEVNLIQSNHKRRQ